MSFPNNSRLILGVGNTFRGDDAIGPQIVLTLEKLNSDKTIDFVVEQGDGLRLIELWEKYEMVFLIDAVQIKNDRPSTAFNKQHELVLIDVMQDEVPRDFSPLSSHTFSLGETIALAKALKRLPKYFSIIGVPGKSFNISQPIAPTNSAIVCEFINAVQVVIDQQIKRWTA